MDGHALIMLSVWLVNLRIKENKYISENEREIKKVERGKRIIFR